MLSHGTEAVWYWISHCPAWHSPNPEPCLQSLLSVQEYGLSIPSYSPSRSLSSPGQPSPVVRKFLRAPLPTSSLLGRGLGDVQAMLVMSLLPRSQSLPVGIPSIRRHGTFLGLLIRTPCYLWAAGRSPASCLAQVLGEKGGLLVARECPQQELSQPMQRRVTPCTTIFAHLTPGCLPLSQPTLVLFPLEIKQIPAKMATEPLCSQWPLGCELGCARTGKHCVSVPQKLFLGFSIPFRAGVASSPLPFPSKYPVPIHFGSQPYRI